MAYTIVSPQPAQRDPSNSSVSAPGLYPDELAVTLDTGEYIAVYVEKFWMDNNQGAKFYASARLTNQDGSTKICPAGNEVVTETVQLIGQDKVTQYGADLISQCFAMAVLGEVVPTVSEQSGDQTVEVTPIGWTDINLAQMSIRHAIAVVNVSGPTTNLASLLTPTPSPAPTPTPSPAPTPSPS